MSNLVAEASPLKRDGSSRRQYIEFGFEASESGGADTLDIVIRSPGRPKSLGSFLTDAPGLARALEALRRIRKRSGEVVIGLGPGSLLERDITLPLAAERSLANVLRFEIPRLTPFEPADLVWRWQVLARNPRRATLLIRLSLVPRAMLQKPLAVLKDLGFVPTRLVVHAPDSTNRDFELRPEGPDVRSAQRFSYRLIAAAVGLLAIAAVAIPFIQAWQMEKTLDAQIDALRPAVAEAQALRARSAALDVEHDATRAVVPPRGQILRLIAALTDLLPDDSFLTELSITQGQLVVHGQANSAADVLAAMGSSPELRNPSFIAPVRRVESGHAELFSLRAEALP